MEALLDDQVSVFVSLDRVRHQESSQDDGLFRVNLNLFKGKVIDSFSFGSALYSERLAFVISLTLFKPFLGAHHFGAFDSRGQSVGRFEQIVTRALLLPHESGIQLALVRDSGLRLLKRRLLLENLWLRVALIVHHEADVLVVDG